MITVARIHGSSFGLQHPGLKADGEVVITRSPARSFARAARAAGASHVVLDNPPAGRLSRLDVGATARYLRFRLGDVALAVI